VPLYDGTVAPRRRRQLDRLPRSPTRQADDDGAVATPRQDGDARPLCAPREPVGGAVGRGRGQGPRSCSRRRAAAAAETRLSSLWPPVVVVDGGGRGGVWRWDASSATRPVADATATAGEQRSDGGGGPQTRLIVLSHWPHVAQQVRQQVAELVAELVFAMYFNGTVHTSNKLSNLLLNLCPRMLLEPFTLDTS